MAIDTKSFWNRLFESQILHEAVCVSLQQSFQSIESQDNANPENLADWLCEQKAISEFQAHILLSDCPGPFNFGNYLIVDRLNGTSQNDRFLGRHTTTGHSVLLDFVAGSAPSALQSWQQIRSAADSLAKSPHPNLLRVFESVAIPQYRFIVSEAPDGQPLLEKIPLKTRLPWKKAHQIVGQAASVLAHLHDRSLNRIRLFPESLWISKSGLLQLMFPFKSVSAGIESVNQSIPDLSVATAANHGDLGDLWFRLLTGLKLDVEPDARKLGIQDIRRLQKFEVPEESIQLIQWMIIPENLICPDAKTIVEHCRRMAPWDESPSSSRKNATLVAYESWLARSPQTINSNSVTGVDSHDFRFDNSSAPSSEPADVDSDVSVVSSINSIQNHPIVIQRRKFGFTQAASIAGSMLAIGILTAIVFALTINRPISTASLEEIDTNRNPTEQLVLKPNEPEALENATAKLVIDGKAGVAKTFDQILIDDDGQSLWETPTVGQPISFRFVPSAPKLAFVFRPAELSSSAEGKRLIQALGPEMNGRIERWRLQAGLALDEIARVTMTLHSGVDFSYHPFFIVETMRSIPADDLLLAWGNPKLVDTGDGKSLYAHGPASAYRFVEPATGGMARFAFGPRALVAESLQLDGADPLAGSMKTLASWSDNDRHASLLFLRSGLFDDAGQNLMAGPMARLNRALSLVIDNNVRGGMLSLHLDQGTYLELRLDRTDDLKAIELEKSFANLLQRLPTAANQFSNSFSASTYWIDAKNRFSAMIDDFSQGWRIGSEDNRFIANCWLPESAVHNLVATTEMMLAFADQRNLDDQAELPIVPQNLEALLAAPRDLAVSTNPDLIILINNLQQEIRDDYGQLPFDFEIRLMGNDLSKEGITQNQRPGNFELKQQSLGDILTRIMVEANPDKNITGASDLNCKLVWVVAADPADASRQIVLITTRSAAAANSYQLPPAFVRD